MSPLAIQDCVRAHYGLRLGDLAGPRRDRHIATPRAVAMYLMRELLGSSYPRIGALFGGRHHTTAIEAVRKVGRWMAVNPDLAFDVFQIRAELAEVGQ